jgi:ribosome maturation factor RimP
MSATDTRLEAVRTVVEPAVRALGLDLYDVELLGGTGARTLRVTVTGNKGVDLDAITEVTKGVSSLVELDEAVPGSYLLEVSSPGIERTLRRPEHFTGAIGEHVSIKYRTESDPCRVRGVLVSVDIDGGRCVVDLDSGEREELMIDDITQARTVFEWGPPSRPAKATGKPARTRRQGGGAGA